MKKNLLFKKAKKGAIEVQFHWIFVLIIGGIILLFFISIMNSQKTAGEQKISTSLSIDIDKIVKTATTQKETLYSIEFPKRKIKLSCNDITIENSPPKPLGQHIIFAPEFIENEKLLVWVKEIRASYPIDNAVYMCAPNSKYYIYNDKDKLKNIYDKLPDKLKENVFQLYNETSQIDIYARPKTLKIVTTNTDFIDDNNIKTLAKQIRYASAITIQGNTLTFYKWNKTQWKPQGTTTYIGNQALLLGAIYEDDIKTYNCILSKVRNKYKYVTQVLTKKAEILANEYSNKYNYTSDSNDKLCSIDYEVAYNALKNIDTNSLKNNLEEINQGMQIDSCTPLY